MSVNDYIESLRRRNPKIFTADKITITTKELEKQIRNAFDAGHGSGLDSKSLFDQLFGRPWKK